MIKLFRKKKDSSTGIKKEIISGFAESRVDEQNRIVGNVRKEKLLLCYAPFNNMFFNSHGQITSCCRSSYIFDKYPGKTLKEIWFGEEFKKLRQPILKGNLSEACNTCRNPLVKGDYANVMARIFDRNDLNKNKFPSVLEFELSNTCNLECKMCLGTLSSSIRKNRDGLPLLPMVYDAVFVEQLKEFIPHAYEAKFYGGEPFLINIYFDILDVIARLNPEIVITITTNGTVLNPKIKDLFEKLKFNINVSIDSVTQATYEKIRINADFDKVMENMHWFRDYCRKNGTIFCICVNPMRQNWQEIPEIIKFFNELEVLVSFNTVYDPPDCSLWNLDSVEIMEIIKKYSEIVLPSANLTEEHNLNKFNGLIRQLETWHNESYENKLNDFKSCIV